MSYGNIAGIVCSSIRKWFLASMGVIIIWCPTAIFAGPAQVSGAEPGLWRADGGLSVVVARVIEVKET
jgi:hypothetical protein